jgi:hypothetical protein
VAVAAPSPEPLTPGTGYGVAASEHSESTAA